MATALFRARTRTLGHLRPSLAQASIRMNSPSTPSARDGRGGLALAFILYTALVAWMFWPSLECIDACYVDLASIHGAMGSFEVIDTLLNTWILAWVQHGLSSQPLHLFDANTFYPASDSLAGSEHLIGLAILSWPLRLFTSNAIEIYQLTLISTFLILALTSYAFVRYTTHSTGLALLAGACAIFMPWRMAELTHIQLLGAQWFPLIWLLALRITLNERRRTDPLLLFCVLSLQLLTSFYLAYSISLSLMICLAVGMLACTPSWRRIRQWGIPVLGAYGLFLLSALPYLSRSNQDQLVVTPEPTGRGLAELIELAWGQLLPAVQTGWSQVAETNYAYSIPLVVALSALFSVSHLFARRRSESDGSLLEGAATWSLWLIVLASSCLMLGQTTQIGNTTVSLPAGWAAAIVPGFENMRAPHRWSIPISLAAPLLAGIGLHAVQRRLRRVSPGMNSRLVAASLYGIVLGLVVINLPWRQLPSATARLSDPLVRAPYERLASLPDGAVMELPWHTEGPYYVRSDAQYMAGSTIHWKKITNGFTAHLPPHFKFLRRVASHLPNPEALTTLRRMVDVRFLVIHLWAMRQGDRDAWREAISREPDLELVYDDRSTLLVEIAQRPDTGIWQPLLLGEPHRLQTLSGLSRAALSSENGQLEVDGPKSLREPIAPVRGIPFSLRLHNRGSEHWPGLDAHREGLVMIRTAWVAEDRGFAGEKIFPLDADLSPGTSLTLEAALRYPGQPGEYWVCFGLVQIQEAKAIPLNVRSAIHRINILPPSGSDPRREADPAKRESRLNTDQAPQWCFDLVPEREPSPKTGT